MRRPAVEVANGAPGRIRLAEITDFSAPSLHGFIAANVAPGITIRTDGWSGYPGAPDVAHDPQVIGPIAAHVVLPWIHRVFSNLKTWALGVYQRTDSFNADADPSYGIKYDVSGSYGFNADLGRLPSGLQSLQKIDAKIDSE